jgi:bifunctional ADP-heptose synthase (sugar kinase/adenylyltransferase)
LGITSVSRTVSPVSGAGDSVGDAVGTVEADGAALSEACCVVGGVDEQLTSTAASTAHATWSRHDRLDEPMPFKAQT